LNDANETEQVKNEKKINSIDDAQSEDSKIVEDN
jgi:hypothetical protein